MENLKSITHYHEIIAGKAILVFSADWCIDCRFIEPFIDEIVASHPEYKFVKVDRDEFIDLCTELDIMGIPSLIAFANQKQIGRFVSRNRKTKAEIEAFIEQLPA